MHRWAASVTGPVCGREAGGGENKVASVSQVEAKGGALEASGEGPVPLSADRVWGETRASRST